MKRTFNYMFERASAILSRQPSYAPAGEFPFLCGVDGRYEGVLRRYPGHIRYPDTNNVLGGDNDGTAISPTHVRYFEVQAAIGSTERIRGFVVGDGSGNTHLHYKFTSDADGVVRREKLSEATVNAAKFSGTTASRFDRGGGFDTDEYSLMGTGDIIGIAAQVGGPTIVRSKVLDFGLGDVLVICGKFAYAGGRFCNGIAYNDGEGWRPLGLPAFDTHNGTFTIHDIEVHDGDLYCCGDFRNYDGGRCDRIAVYDLTAGTWSQVGGGLGDTAYTLLNVSDTDFTTTGEYLYVGGKFTTADINSSSVNASRVTYWRKVTGVFVAHTGNLGFNDNAVRALVYHNDKVVAMGTFTQDDTPTLTFAENTAWIDAPGDDWNDPASNGTPPTQTFSVNNAAIVSSKYDSSTEKIFAIFPNTSTTSGLFSLDIADTSGTWVQVSNFQTTATPTGASLLDTSATLMHYGIVESMANLTHDLVELAMDSNGVGSSPTSVDTLTSLDVSTTEQGVGALVSFKSSTYAFGTGFSFASGTSCPQDSLTWDVCSRGPYLYIYAENGNHKVLYWEPTKGTPSTPSVLTTGSWTTRRLSPGQTWLATFDAAGVSDTTSISTPGSYVMAHRWVDRERGRYSALSQQSNTFSVTDIQAPRYLETDSTKLQDSLDHHLFPSFQGFVTTSSGDSTIAGGGDLWRFAEASMLHDRRGDQGMLEIRFGSTDEVDESGASGKLVKVSMSDLALPQDPTRLYDFIEEQVTDIGSVVACARYQGVTFVLEKRDSHLDIRWTATFRDEPENFPAANIFPTEILISDAATCRMLVVGDYLFVFGGNRIYRIQRGGRTVGIVELLQDYPFVHRDAIVKVGSTIYAATQLGLLVIQAQSGASQILPGLDRIFFDRWRSPAGSSTDLSGLRMGYDAKMRCIYLHHVDLYETVCIWPGTGKITLLMHHPADGLVTGEDLDTEKSIRCYFLTSTGWFSSPNWDPSSTEAEVMGVPLFGTDSLYNQKIASITAAGVITLTGTSATQFTFAGSTLRTPYPLYVFFHTGARAGEVALVTTGSSKFKMETGTSTAGLAVAGDVISIAPIPFGVLGSNLWGGIRTPVHTNRKTIMGMTILPVRVASPGTLGGQTIPLNSSYGIFTYGALRHDDVIRDEPRTSKTTPIFRFRGDTGSSPLGKALSEKPSDNWDRTLWLDGTLIYPALLCMTSNLRFELDFWKVEGEIFPGDVTS